MAIEDTTRQRRKKITQQGGPRRRRRASNSYLALIHAYPLRPIRTEQELDEAIAVVDKLLTRERLDDQEQDYLESLGHEIERYEEEAYPMPEISGEQMLRHLMDARGASLSEVADETSIAISTLSAILNGKRKINVKHLQALSSYFGVEPGVFLS